MIGINPKISMILIYVNVVYIALTLHLYDPSAWFSCLVDMRIKIILFLSSLLCLHISSSGNFVKYQKYLFLFIGVALTEIILQATLSQASNWTVGHLIFYLIAFTILFLKFRHKLSFAEALAFTVLTALSISFLWELIPTRIYGYIFIYFTQPTRNIIIGAATNIVEALPTVTLFHLIRQNHYCFTIYPFIPAIVLGLLLPHLHMDWVMKSWVLRGVWLLPFLTLKTRKEE